MNQMILIVDDDVLMRRTLMLQLQRSGYRTQMAESAEEALALARQHAPDLVLLDIGLPGMDGLEAMRHFRDEVEAPVIFITARRRELDEILGLELGAEDYITKPFDIDVLRARVKVVLRRALRLKVPPAPPPTRLQVDDLVVDLIARTVTLAGKALQFPRRTFDLLALLAEKAGQVVKSEELLERVWGANYQGEPQVIYVHIRWLREKLERDPRHPKRIVTLHGVGYKLVRQAKDK